MANETGSEQYASANAARSLAKSTAAKGRRTAVEQWHPGMSTPF